LRIVQEVDLVHVLKKIQEEAFQIHGLTGVDILQLFLSKK